MRTLLDPLAAVVAAVGRSSQATALANARRAATEASARRVEREELAAFLDAASVALPAPRPPAGPSRSVELTEGMAGTR